MANKQLKRPNIFQRQWLIIKDFQLGFLSQLSLILLVILIGFHFIEQYHMSQIIEQEQKEFVELDLLYPLMRKKMEVVFAIKSLFLMFTLMLWGMWFSHRAAGPVYRVLKILDALKEGKQPDTFKLRKTDYFQDLGSKLEDLVKDKKI